MVPVSKPFVIHMAVERSEGNNLPKSGGAMAPPGTTPLAKPEDGKEIHN